MPQPEDTRFVELTLVRLQGAKLESGKQYVVEYAVGGEKEEVAFEVEGSAAELNKHLKWPMENGCKLRIEVYFRVKSGEKRWKSLVGEIQKDLSKFVSDSSNEIEIPLELHDTKNKDVGVQALLRLKFQLREAAQNMIDTIPNTLPVEGSKTRSFKTILISLRRFADIVSGVAEINPNAKAAVALMLSISNVFTSQIDRDEKIMSLVDCIDDAYALVLGAEGLSKIGSENIQKCIDAMLRQTIECGHFIQTYFRSNFGSRALKAALLPSVDKTIASYKDKFSQFKQDFQTATSLHTTISVCRIMGNIQNIDASINLDDITYAEGMRYDGSRGCLPATREAILEQIINWANGCSTEDEKIRVFLLTGLAGSGKSTIAHSVASHFDKQERLVSSFFCSRTKLENSKPEKVFCTVARDIADSNAAIKQNLWRIVENKKALRKTESVQEQFEKFIKEPVTGLELLGPMVIVIDALDECEGDLLAKEKLLETLAESFSLLPSNFRVFLTARSGDVVIQNAFKAEKACHLHLALGKVARDSVRMDISKFIWHKLSAIQSDLAASDPQWQQKLTAAADDSFIWAATACVFITGKQRAGLLPNERLKHIILGGPSTRGTLKAIFTLYEQVLENVLEKDDAESMARYKAVMATILTTFTPLSTVAIDNLMSVGCSQIISHLGAVLTGSADETEPVQVLHTSFRDYLTDSIQGNIYFVDTTRHHSQMAKYCLDIMNKELKVNICGFEDLYILYDDMPAEELTKRTKSNIGEALQYACRYWPLHITQMNPIDYDTVKEPLHRFLFGDKRLMQWIEVVSMLKMMDVVLKSVNGLLKWFKANMQNDGEIYRMVYDCFRFLDSYSYPITRGPLQVYHSAISYVPTKTALCDVYCEISGLEPRVVFEREEEWSSLRSKLQMNGVVRAAAFTPDGARVVCVSANGKLRVFEFATSAHLGEPMECSVENKDSLRFALLAFSHDGSHFAISTPESIEVWSVERRVCTVRDVNIAAKETRTPITFLSNDCVVACRVNGRSVELWSRSLSNGESAIHSCIVDEEIVYVAMSPSGRFFGCLTKSGNVFVWDTQSQEEIAHFKVDCQWFFALGISSDGEYVAASILGRVTMWSRSRGEIIWEKECEWTVREILMPLSTDCGRFVTSSIPNYVWDFATGDCYNHESSLARAVSADGRYLVTRDADIYSIEDADRPHWEPISVAGEADANKPSLLKNEQLKHMLFLSDGSLSAAGNNDNTVFIWDGLGTADARKHILKGLTSTVKDVKISPDGLKLASWDGKNVLRWNRNSVNMQFDLELRERSEINVEEMAFAPDGSLILAAVTEGRTSISVWEQLGTANVMKYTLKPHTSRYLDVRFSADGMKIASLSEGNTVFVSAKQSPVARFELSSTHRFENDESASLYFVDPSRWDEENTTPAMTECTSPEQRSLLPISEVGSGKSKTLLRYEWLSEWVMTAEGKRLWWIPDRFRGVSTQLGKRIVVYNAHTAVLFAYADKTISNRTT